MPIVALGTYLTFKLDKSLLGDETINDGIVTNVNLYYDDDF